ncbi:1-phosphatidylinositol-3-phosphate 5-kinase FAB1B-like isoform X2 [Musa acuminata AAA Group]|uniref:1-phosphatidylinositol-3-phosphate 5-kinase FAB1B-like isoform X2 n=1 Tax=Musa acuminata AAA Group TaxID=214697 RepID=UPI0031E45000
MENSDNAFSELVSIVKSWIPRRSEPPNVSRNFWMPDHSCRVCYECDAQFTVFNRRHHCRHCGRIFCGKCTANFIPATSDNLRSTKEVGERERIRVCNFCFKQWDQRISSTDNAFQQYISPALSSTSIVSTKSSGTINSNFNVESYSSGPYHLIPYGPAPNPCQSVLLEPCSDKPDLHVSARSIDAVEIGSHRFGYVMNRSDDDDYEYGGLHDSETQHFQHYDDYGGQDEFNGVDQDCYSNKMIPAEVDINLENICSPAHNTQLHATVDADKMDEENEPDCSYECNASPSIYEIENADAEPVDFENNGLLWLPPDPEDEEDERESILIDDDEDEDSPTGEWNYDHSSNGFGSGDFRTRDRSIEEHKKAMKNIVDGHFKVLIAQLLQVENLSAGDDDRGSWLDIVTFLSWEAANFLKPDTSNDGGMDPGGYVKVKCLACGHRSESKVVRGVVCKKNVAHRRMQSKIEKPRFLILGGALEYQRVTNTLSSFDTLLQQEMDHLKMAVAKIAAHQPNVLLVEKSVSRFAQDYLLAKDISLVLNIKRPLLERITRCTGAHIVPSIDHLSSPMLGHCDLFHVEKYREDHTTAAQGGKKMLKNLMFFEGCPKPLGCTNYRCRSCDMPSEAHVHCYTHRYGSLTISVRKFPEILLPGERDGKIWMWHRCLMCRRNNGFPPATRRVVMSDAAWGLSFGKFLELSFSNHAAASRVASCGHSLHRDCLRFYGFGRMVACFRYASINVHSVYLPPPKVDFNYQHQEWISKEANEVAERAENLFREIHSDLCQFKETMIQNGSMEVPEFRHHIVELQDFLQTEKAEFEDVLHKVLKKEVRKGEPVIDILEVNKLRRQLIFHSYLWDQRLLFAAELDNCPKGICNSFLTREKEKHCTVEKIKDLNLALKPQKDSQCSNAAPVEFKTDELFEQGTQTANNPEGLFGHHDSDELGQKIRDVEMDSMQEKQNQTSLYTSISATESSILLESGLVGRRTLSDGQFPVLTNLSDTFDARWIGDSGTALADVMIQDLIVPMENSVAMPISEGSEERAGADITQSFTSILLSKLGDSAEDFSARIGIPFVNIYRTINKNWVNSPRFSDLNEYSSVFRIFLRELERQGGARFLLPVGLNDTVIPIYDDEPTSIISFALVSPEYHVQLSDERDRIRDGTDSSPSLPLYDAGNFLSQSFDETFSDPFKSFGSTEDNILSLSGSRGSLVLDKTMHVRVSFTDEGPFGKVKYTVTCYYAKCFDALRRACCPSELDFIRSLSRCKKWGAQGGKSNVFFAKSLDDRFIVKQVTKTELESFIKFAPEYFKYYSESIATGSPTSLAKILGIYQVTSKNLKGGKDIRMDVLVMENLLFRRNITRLYDLKGSSRSRYNPDSSGNNKVLLDQNLIEAMPTSPIFVGNKAKRLLERAVWNDTSFLASIDVMDYSLLVGVDEEKHELVLGIIDFMRQYTWDKHLETWVKASGILGGPKNVSPTVISPKQYKKRFRKAMSAYFLVVPEQWSPPTGIPNKPDAEISQENQQGATTEGN